MFVVEYYICYYNLCPGVNGQENFKLNSNENLIQ